MGYVLEERGVVFKTKSVYPLAMQQPHPAATEVRPWVRNCTQAPFVALP